MTVSLEEILPALVEGAQALDLSLSEERLRAVARFGALLMRWNRRINLLSGRTDTSALVERHLLDSLAVLRVLRPWGRVLDVGSGAGLPALPLHIVAPADSLTLLEPTGKRAAFLRAAAAELALEGVDVRSTRLEALASDRFDVLSSRATFAPAEWLRRALPHLAPGGRVVAMLGREEPDAVIAVGESIGLEVVATDALTLRLSGARRTNVVFRVKIVDRPSPAGRERL